MYRDLLQQRECEAVSHVKESMTMVESSLMEKEQVRGFTVTSSSPSYMHKKCNVEVHTVSALIVVCVTLLRLRLGSSSVWQN